MASSEIQYDKKQAVGQCMCECMCIYSTNRLSKNEAKSLNSSKSERDKKKTPKDWIKIIEVDGRQTDIPTATFIHTLAHTQTHKKKSKREKERTARDKRATEKNTRCVCCEKQ